MANGTHWLQRIKHKVLNEQKSICAKRKENHVEKTVGTMCTTWNYEGITRSIV